MLVELGYNNFGNSTHDFHCPSKPLFDFLVGYMGICHIHQRWNWVFNH